jgi:hypothetical protein
MIMGGFGHAVGIIFGAFAFRATMAAASKLTAVAKNKGCNTNRQT